MAQDLIFFGGKGGVGKSTTSAATAIHLARMNPEKKIFLISFDIAHNLGDLFDMEIGDKITQVLPNLWAMEPDADRYAEDYLKDFVVKAKQLAYEMPLVKKLTTRPPFGAKVTAKVVGTTPWWTTDPEGPAFEAARRALKAGYGKQTAMIGAGGSIGFVGPFAELLGGAPSILMGVEDPLCNAHSENESLHLGDWLKSMRSAVFMYDELSRVETKKAAKKR